MKAVAAAVPVAEWEVTVAAGWEAMAAWAGEVDIPTAEATNEPNSRSR